jgi:tetratricopeptide (TPR) repeat protein
MRRASGIFAAALCLALLSGSALARPSRTLAEEHFRRGNQLYRDGDYAAAAAELEQGYASEPRPDILYAIGQAERKLGNCQEALRYYQQYLATGPSPTRRAAAQLQIDLCQQALATAPVSPAPAPEKPAPPVSPAATVTPAAPARVAAAPVSAQPARDHGAAPARVPVYKRWWLWTTVIGLAAAGAGIGLGIALSEKSGFDPTLPDLVIARAGLKVRF